MSLISIKNLTFAYPGSYDNIFEDVSFALDTDWRLGFTGRNGRGKTTFLSLLMGQYEYQGAISASVSFRYFPFPVADPDQTAQAVAEQTGGGWQQWELLRELSLLQVAADALDRPFCTLSSGEQTKVLLATLFLQPDSFLLIDEPTNHLDSGAREVVSRYLQGKSGFILVSHDRRFLDNCVDHILAINKQDIQVQKGNFSAWWAVKQQRDNWELEENQRLRGDIKRLSAAAKKTADWSAKVEKSKFGTLNSAIKPDRGYTGHKAAKMMQRSKNISARQQCAIEEKSGLLKNIEDTEPLKLFSAVYHKKRLVELRDVAICYGETPVCQSIRFAVEQGDRVALAGKNGSGKSSLLKLILGQDIPHTGVVEVGSGVKISDVSQETAFLRGGLPEFERERRLDTVLFRAILRKLDFARMQFEKPMEDYSGGQKKKVLLAASLCNAAHLYIWDEPLNFVDIFSRIQLTQLILDAKPTMIFVEHDAAFAEQIATKTVVLY